MCKAFGFGPNIHGRGELSMIDRAKKSEQAGSSLIEVLIAVLVVSVGLLGTAGLQLASLKNNQSAMQRSEAVVLTYSILDRMRANRDVAAAGSYDMSLPADLANCAAPGNVSLAEQDLTEWVAEIQSAFGAGVACGAVDCDSNFNCTVTLQWDDSLSTEGNAEQQVVTEGKI